MNKQLCGQCDCQHPSECLYNQDEGRPAAVIVYAFAAILIAVVILVVALW